MIPRAYSDINRWSTDESVTPRKLSHMSVTVPVQVMFDYGMNVNEAEGAMIMIPVPVRKDEEIQQLQICILCIQVAFFK